MENDQIRQPDQPAPQESEMQPVVNTQEPVDPAPQEPVQAAAPQEPSQAAPQQAAPQEPAQQSAFTAQPGQIPGQPGAYPNQQWWPYPPVYWQPTKPVREKKPGQAKKVFKGIFSTLGILAAAAALVAASSVVTTLLVSNAWEQKYATLDKDYQEKYALLNEACDNRIDVLQEKLEKLEEELEQQPVIQEPSTQEPSTQEPDTQQPSQSTIVTVTESSAQVVYDQNVDAVVMIYSTSQVYSYFGQSSTQTSTGSGFIISEDGYVVTNYHVIEGGSEVSVLTHTGQEHTAAVVGYDANHDVALLKIEGENLPYVTLGSSDDAAVGSGVVAIGYPLSSQTPVLTVGVVSAKDQSVSTSSTSQNMLQTDVAINSGNSGGPLFNMAGQVVGITTAKSSGYSSSGVAIEGISYAIPIDDVKSILEDLQDFGYVKGAYLGVYINEIDSSVAEIYGLPAGVYVSEVVEGFCAQKAGVQAGDIIVDLGGYETGSFTALDRALQKFESGQETTITVMRNGAKVILRITLDERPQTDPEPQEQISEETQPQFDGFFGNG